MSAEALLSAQNRDMPAGEVFRDTADPQASSQPDAACDSHLPGQLPDAAAHRLAQWRGRLLDLSLRNPLLNLRDSRTTIPLLAPEPAALESALATGRHFVLEALPAACAAERSSLARNALAEGRLLAPLQAERLDNALLELYRKARSELEEGGAGTLFLAIGLLRWQRPGEAARHYRAPLLLLPVSLSRRSASAAIRLERGEDEACFNTTLLEMLREDFALELPGFKDVLPSSGESLDFAAILGEFRHVLRDLEGFEVLDELHLGQFSFARYLMWKDLGNRQPQLYEHPLLRRLLDGGPLPVRPDGFVTPAGLDHCIDPGALFTPLPADSSQLAAILAAAAGHDFVMVGPPGTGKSQTIANMIAHNLALGRRVLFVAEKAAALEVVHRRLREHGLGDFCLELHSGKARKAEVFQQLIDSWNSRGTLRDIEWQRETQRLGQQRDSLNALVEALHRRHHNGLTVRDTLARLAAAPEVPHLELCWRTLEARGAGRSQWQALAARLAGSAAALGMPGNHPLAGVASTDWTPDWQRALLEQARRVAVSAAGLAADLAHLRSQLGLVQPFEGRGPLAALDQLLRLLPRTRGMDLDFAFRADVLERLEALNRALVLLREQAESRAALSAAWPGERLPGLDLAVLRQRLHELQDSWWPLRRRRERQLRDWLQAETGVDVLVEAADLPHLARLQQLHQQLQALTPRLLGLPLWQGADSDAGALAELAGLAWQLRSLPAALAGDAVQLAALHEGLRRSLQEEVTGAAGDTGLLALADRCLVAGRELQQALEPFAALLGRRVEELYAPGEAGLTALAAFASRLQQHAGQLQAWCAWQHACNEAAELGLGPLAQAIEAGRLSLDADLPEVLELNYARAWLAAQLDVEPALRDFTASGHEKQISEFRALDDRVRAITAEYIRTRIHQQRNDREAGRHSRQFAVLRRELERPQPQRPLRQLLAEAPQAIAALTPCFLMSPRSVAQYLPAGQQPFDLVIFDEASQVGTWEAIGAIARGRQLVVVGDPRQLPPTGFFAAAPSTVAETPGSESHSILDTLLDAGLPVLNLAWHYRSRHESLIAFANHRYYQGGLVTFPSPQTTDRAVSLVQVDGLYARGASQTNSAEAEAVVAEIRARLQGIEPGVLSLGVVTFNQKQQSLILDLLEVARRADPALDRHFAETLIEPVFVKNLEAVQGDERDLILFSTTFGPDRQGRLSMNFGPLNQRGGERRLNVAITRARRELRVFTSLRPEQFDLSRSSAPGVHDLCRFLAFAAHGPQALERPVDAPDPVPGGFGSPLEAVLARELGARGWTVQAQVGTSRFRIDLAVVDPDAPQCYLAGIECDGATYQRAATARDRDKVREEVLRALGWEILRLWSVDYWRDPQGCLERLDRQLHELRRRRRGTE